MNDHILRGLPHCQVRILLIFSNKSEVLAVPATTLNATTNATLRRCTATAAAAATTAATASASATANDDNNEDDDDGIYLVRLRPLPHARCERQTPR